MISITKKLDKYLDSLENKIKTVGTTGLACDSYKSKSNFRIEVYELL